MKYYVSIDYTDTKPIACSDLVAMAFSVSTENEYADYLQYVLNKAKRITGNIKKVKFRIHQTGCVIPFGEGSFHPYSKNFYSWLDLPQIPVDLRKAH